MNRSRSRGEISMASKRPWLIFTRCKDIAGGDQCPGRTADQQRDAYLRTIGAVCGVDTGDRRDEGADDDQQQLRVDLGGEHDAAGRRCVAFGH